MSYNQNRGLLGWNLSKATWWHHRYYANLLSLNQHVSNVSCCPTIIIWMTQSCDYFFIPVCIGRKPSRIFHLTKSLSLSPILSCCFYLIPRYSDVVMSAMASQITSLTIVYSTVYSDAGLCEGNSLLTGEVPTQRASNAENDSISWYHHGFH